MLLRFVPFCVVCALTIAPLLVTAAGAQTPSNVEPAAPLSAGTCSVTVKLGPGTDPQAYVDVDVNGMWVARKPVNGRQSNNTPVLEPIQVNLLANLATWSVTNADSRRIITGALSDVLPGEARAGGRLPAP